MRVYTVQFNNVSVTAVQDLFSIMATASQAFRVHEVRLGQTTATTVGNLRVSIKRLPATVTQGSGGATPTPQRMNSGDSAATITAHTNDTTQASTSGTASVLLSDEFNVVNNWVYWPAPEDRPTIAPGQCLVVTLDTAPSAAQSMSGTITLEELF